MQFYRGNVNLTRLNRVVLLACLIKVLLKYTGKPHCIFLSHQVLANYAQYTYKPAGSVWFYHGGKICIFWLVKEKRSSSQLTSFGHIIGREWTFFFFNHFFGLPIVECLDPLVIFTVKKKINENIWLIFIFHLIGTWWTPEIEDKWDKSGKARQRRPSEGFEHFVTRLWDGLRCLSERHVCLQRLMLMPRYCFLKSTTRFNLAAPGWTKSLSHILSMIHSKFKAPSQCDKTFPFMFT